MRFCFEIVFRRLDPDVDEVASSTCSHDGETDESVWNVCLALLDSEESLTVPSDSRVLLEPSLKLMNDCFESDAHVCVLQILSPSASAAFSCAPAIRLSHPKSDVFQ